MSTHPFFHSQAWSKVIEQGFGARNLKISLGTPVAFTLFKGGPFRLAYVNFPIGLVDIEETLAVITPDIAEFLRSQGAQVLHFVTPHLTQEIGQLGDIYLPETLIENLVNWEEARLPAEVRYKVRRSRREGLRARKVSIEDSKYLYALYKATVARHGGQIRYTLKYFQALTALAEQNQYLDCRVGMPADRDEPCAFIVIAHDGDTAYYLHGGYDARYAYLRSGYGLMNLAIAYARDNGCKVFNLMTSPADQPALVKFKEKWGGVTRQIVTHREPLNFAGKVLIRALCWRDRFFKLLRVDLK